MSSVLHLLAGSWPDVVVAGLAGPLAVAGLAKLVTPPQKLKWPIKAGALRPPHGPRLAGLTEVAAAVAIVLLPGRMAAVVALAVYALLTAAAYAMRGQECACFGVARLAAVGRLHIGVNAGAALVAAVVALTSPPGTQPALRAGIFLLAAGVTFGAVLVASRRRDAQDAVPSCGEQVSAVRLYVSDNCPACSSLKQLLAAMEPARRDAITTIVVDLKEPLPESVSGLGVPCAMGLNAAGEPICSPVSGIGAVKAFVDTIGVPAAARGH
jgi:hypothetical protein